MTFSEQLRTMMIERDLYGPDIYKKVNMDRKLFSKISSRSDYHPSKETAVLICIGLELSMEETQKLLASAGFVLTENSRFDAAIMRLIDRGIYNIYDINEALDSCGLKCLGCTA